MKRIRPMPIVGVYDGTTVRIVAGFLVVIRDFSSMRAPDLAYWLRSQQGWSPTKGRP